MSPNTNPAHGETVYVCEYLGWPRTTNYHDAGEWSVIGVLADEADAQSWVDDQSDGTDHPTRRYHEWTVGIVHEPQDEQ